MRGGYPPPADRLHRDGHAPAAAAWSSSRSQADGAETLYSQNYACDDCGVSHAGAFAPDVFLQQSLWRLPGVYRPGLSAKGSTRSWSSRTRAVRSGTAASRPVRLGQRQIRFHLRGCILKPWRKIPLLPAGPDQQAAQRRDCRRFYTAPAGKSCSCTTHRGNGRRDYWSSPLRAFCPIWSAAIGRPSPTRCARSWSPIWRPTPCPECHGRAPFGDLTGGDGRRDAALPISAAMPVTQALDVYERTCT